MIIIVFTGFGNIYFREILVMLLFGANIAILMESVTLGDIGVISNDVTLIGMICRLFDI